MATIFKLWIKPKALEYQIKVSLLVWVTLCLLDMKKKTPFLSLERYTTEVSFKEKMSMMFLQTELKLL